MTDYLEGVECPNCFRKELETGEDSDGRQFYCCRDCGDLGPKDRVIEDEGDTE